MSNQTPNCPRCWNSVTELYANDCAIKIWLERRQEWGELDPALEYECNNCGQCGTEDDLVMRESEDHV